MFLLAARSHSLHPESPGLVLSYDIMISMNIVLVTGNRDWEWRDLLEATLEALDIHVLIEGEANGADRMSREWADANDFRAIGYEQAYAADALSGETRYVVPVPAQWDRYGKAAGSIRNTKMVQLLVSFRDRGMGHDCKVVAFARDITKSVGTKNCYRQAKDAGFDPILVDGKEQE